MTLVICAALAFGCSPSGERADDATMDKPTMLAHQVMDAVGGEERWNELRGLRWTFAVEHQDTIRSVRRHAWDKHGGWHRVEGTTRAGDDFCFIHNLNTGEGRAWMGGNAIEGDSLQKLIALAKSMWTNDSYWFLMPYKLLDPGVHREMQGTVDMDGMTCDKLALNFDPGVGETSGDQYWVYVDQGSRRVVQWEYLLEGREPPPVMTTWENWEEHDGLWFATTHNRENGAIYTRDVETVAAFDPAVFEAP